VRAENTKRGVQGHFNGSFCYRKKDFFFVGFGVNRLGAHYNAVSTSIMAPLPTPKGRKL
jgi:hypothetical protein